MADYACIVQAGQTAESKQEELSTGLKEIARETFGDATDSADIKWISVGPGFGFTAGEPSTSSLIIRSVPEGYPDAQRTELMAKLSRFWERVTGCTAGEIVVTAFDGPLPL